MVGLTANLKRLFTRNTPEPVIQLPADVLTRMGEGSLQKIHDYVESIVRANPRAPEFDLLVAEARRRGWPPKEIEKLEIFGHYYRVDMGMAYEGARKYAEGPDFDPDLFIITVFALYHSSQFEEAYRLIAGAKDREHLFARRPDFHTVAALVYRAANRLPEMKTAIDTARRLDPDNPVVAMNAYAMYLELGEMDAFTKIREEIHAGRYQTDEAGFALGNCELALGNYAEGFKLLELRYKLSDAARYMNVSLFSRPRWQGEDLAGRTLLISAEQGLGDAVMMARYLPAVLALGSKVVLECKPEVIPLLAYNFPELAVVPVDYQTPQADFDVWVGFMSLPHILGCTPENIPGRAGYLAVPPENRDYWRGRVAELAPVRRPRIGLAWSGSPTHRGDRRRSIPFPRLVEAIQNLEADFFALQTQVPEFLPPNVIDVSEEMVTLSDTGALIAEMDLVITVDTSAVHLAGALGKKTWLLLPYRYEWRWGLEGERNNWYDSVTVIRQPTGADWDSVLKEVFGPRWLEFNDKLIRSS